MLFLSTLHTAASGPPPKLISFSCIYSVLYQSLPCRFMPALSGLGYNHLECKDSVSLNSSKECECSMGLQNIFQIMMINPSKN